MSCHCDMHGSAVTTTTEQHTMSLRLPEDLYEWLRAEAFRQRTSMSKLIAYALLAYRDRESP